MNNIKQANRCNRIGIQWAAVLRLACNVSADNSDICALDRKHLFLDAAIPYLKLPRSKSGIFRVTPLLPSTVAALKAWVEVSQSEGRIFSTERGPYTDHDQVAHGFDLIWSEIDEALRYDRIDVDIEERKKWSFKHLKNIGSNTAKNNRMRDLVTPLLGHVEVTGNADGSYLAGHDEGYLLPLVNLIGRDYFGGETVAQ